MALPAVPIALPRRCIDCGDPVSRRARRCRSCHGQYALAAARRSPNRARNRPVGGPIGDVVALFRRTGVVVRPSLDRRSAVVIGSSGLVIVECADRLDDKVAGWFAAVDRAAARGVRVALYRGPQDADRLIDLVGADRPPSPGRVGPLAMRKA